MLISPVNSINISFGRKEKQKQKSFVFPGILVGGLAGTGYSNYSKININKDNVEESIKTIDTKLSKTLEQKEKFELLLKNFSNIKKYKENTFQKIGIEKKAQTVSVQNVLAGVIDDSNNKTIQKLNDEINHVSNEIKSATNLTPEEITAKKLALDLKIKVKELIEKSTDGKIKVSDLDKYFSSLISNNDCIKDGLTYFSEIIKSFNKKRLFLFSIIGASAGAFLGNKLKVNNK